MTITQSLLLGILQGLTEFLPVSSSGHLALSEYLLGLQIDPQSLQGFDILLHAGTLVALLATYASVWWSITMAPFKRDWPRIRLLGLLILATVPGALAGLLFADFIAAHLRSPFTLGLSFFVTALVLLLGERSGKTGRTQPTFLGALWIGIAQAIAIVPGLSRSGFTISAARGTGLDRRSALDFSFLLAVPIIAGASLLTIRHIIEGAVVLPSLSVTIAGFLSSCVASTCAIIFLRRFVAAYSLAWFAWYLMPLGLIVLLQASAI